MVLTKKEASYLAIPEIKQLMLDYHIEDDKIFSIKNIGYCNPNTYEKLQNMLIEFKIKEKFNDSFL